MQLSLNAIWGVRARPSRSGLLILLRNRLLSLTVVLVIGFVMLVSLLFTVVLSAVIRFAEEWLPIHASVVTLTELMLSLALITLLFAMIFRILPDVVLSWRDVVPGALLTAALFVLGRYLIATYLTLAAPASAYGAAGSLVLLLMWVYYSSLILLFGAAFTKTLLLHRGGRVVSRNLAVRVHNELVED
jgi:YihY family inner membrane protein